MLRLAFRNLFRHGVRTALTLAAIALGVAALVLTGGFIEDVFVQLREATIHSQLGHLQVSREGYSRVGRRDPYRYLIERPETLAATLTTVPEVEDVLLRLNLAALASNGRGDRPALVEGVEPDKEARLGTFISIVQGRNLSAEDRFGALVGQGLAKALQVGPGDTLTLLGNTAEGALNSLDFDVVGIFRSFSRDFDDRAVRVPLESAQELFASAGVHTLVLRLGRTEATDTALREVGARLGAQGVEVLAWYDLAEFYRKTVDLYRRQFGVLQVIILAMVLLGVANSVNLALYERTAEFGTLMALGQRSREVFMLIVVENAILGMVGAAVGVLFGIGVAWAASEVGIPMPPPPNSDVGYTARVLVVPWVVGTAFAVGAVATVLASLLPARRASRMPVVEALRASL